MKTVAIIGASDKPGRYANMAMHDLREHGYDVVLVNPFRSEIEGHRCFGSVDEYDGEIDTVTLYVNPARFHGHIEEVIKARPRRVIMNPGTEDRQHERTLSDAGIEVQRACTLVLLSQDQF
ncbi:MAG: CoA-binding protein [Gammaproteobacteria bacterium]|nr:CoA-binding protein [Gammaproteobacteria bacterium]NNJ50342.1 CoA-binding protein [Gammaproteobacteria bacterium]